MSEKISEKDLYVLTMMYDLGSITEVAKALDMPLGTVRKCVERNRDKLADMAATEISLLAPKAINTLRKAMDEDGSVPKGDIRLNAAKEALDRMGVGAKFREERAVTITPIILMPEKSLQRAPIEVTQKES